MSSTTACNLGCGYCCQNVHRVGPGVAGEPGPQYAEGPVIGLLGHAGWSTVDLGVVPRPT